MPHPECIPETVLPVCRQIGLNETASQTVLAHLPSTEEILGQHALLQQNPDAFFALNDARPDCSQRYLALFAAFALLSRKTYAEREISEAVWADTMHDIARWAEAFESRQGVPGVSVPIARWLARHIRLELFQLGALQFEPLRQPECPLPDELQALPVLNVHIPKGTDLSRRGESYAQALSFFGYSQAVAVCDSWLLSPALKSLLAPDSRILAFQSEFTIVCLDQTSRQAEQRIFGPLEDDPALYPVRTSLQRRAREALLRGEKLPSALGWKHLL